MELGHRRPSQKSYSINFFAHSLPYPNKLVRMTGNGGQQMERVTMFELLWQSCRWHEKNIYWKKLQKIFTKCQPAALHFALLNFSRTHQSNCKSQYPDKGNKAGEATQCSETLSQTWAIWLQSHFSVYDSITPGMFCLFFLLLLPLPLYPLYHTDLILVLEELYIGPAFYPAQRIERKAFSFVQIKWLNYWGLGEGSNQQQAPISR